MQVRAGVGWQYALADLALILFLVCAAALGQSKAAAPAAPPPQLAEPAAVWRAGAVPLRAWLDSQPRDPRQTLTIRASYTGLDPATAFTRASALAHEGGAARIVVEPGASDDLAATLDWDAALVARSVLGPVQPIKGQSR